MKPPIGNQTNRFTTGLGVLALVSFLLACASGPRAIAADTVSGTALDANTNEPIVGAWVFQTEGRPATGADVSRIERVSMTRTDETGHFRFDAPGRWLPFGRSDPPHYLLYHPSYGLIRARASADGRSVRFRPSLRDAHLRQADATFYCNAPRRDAMAEKLFALACPPGIADHYADGTPRARGRRDERGRRDGTWTFYREDGSVIARGEYRAGAAVGEWRFEDPSPGNVDPD